jgi:tetratricopeptide (TPR) repeat protein
MSRSLRLRAAARAVLVCGCLVGRWSTGLCQQPELAALLAGTPPDSLAGPLRRLESRLPPPSGAEAAMTLGQLHYMRGEYRDAAAAFGRAAARLDPARKPDARYWAGLSWLGLGDAAQARAALEEVARTSGTRRTEASLGVAQAWDLARRPERALEVIDPLADQNLGETGPALLERLAALDERMGRAEPAHRARLRLLREYPRSTEAAAARLTLAAAAPRPGRGAVAVLVGSFVDPARAQSLASEARRSGFPGAEVVVGGDRPAVLHLVRLGIYSSTRQAKSAGEEATRALGVTFQIVRAP